MRCATFSAISGECEGEWVDLCLLVCSFYFQFFRFAESLGFSTIRDYTPWMYNDQVAGFVNVFEKFAYTTIRASGHMVPSDAPGPALKMFYKFIDSN